MYNTQHRGLGPPPTGNSNRLADLMDQLRAEFENQARNLGEYEHQVTGQIQEMEMIRNKIYAIEQATNEMKQRHVFRGDLVIGMRANVVIDMRVKEGLVWLHHPLKINSSLLSTLYSLQVLALNHKVPRRRRQDNRKEALPVTSPAPLSMPPQPTASPGPGKSRGGRGPPGPATPQQVQQQVSYPDPRASPQVPRPTPPQPGPHRGLGVGNELAKLMPEALPESLKRTGDDWHAVFNPEVPRVLDVNLVHHLTHESVVCCVRFSHDGKYVATGSNRSAQIFEVASGSQVSQLIDETVDKDGDLYIRSVCFSPDGRYLATGAEDKLIRVWDIPSRRIKHTFAGHEQDIYSLDFAKNGRHIASGSGDKTVRLWDIEAAQQVLTLSIEDGVTTVAISPDGRYVAAGSLDRSVRVWDSTSGYLVERLEGPEGHQDSVYSVAFAPNGRDLVSGSLDKTIKMWELTQPRGILPGNGPKGGKCVRTFEGHKVRTPLCNCLGWDVVC
ncbi:MAG: hypothetical protein Q9160_000744 [Pyrenula sp. 1 TL-2023]